MGKSKASKTSDKSKAKSEAKEDSADAPKAEESKSAEHHDEDFETVDAGASHTYPQQAGDLKKGSFVMIKGNPCKVAEISMSKTGKHGHAKAHIVALDIFTSKKYEDLCPSSHNVECPFVKRTEYTLLNIDDSSGSVSLLLDNGETKEDLNLPCYKTGASPTEEDEKIQKNIKEDYEAGKNVIVQVLSACGEEKIIGHKVQVD